MADRTVTVGSGKTYSTPALAVAGESDFQTGEDNIVFIIDAGQYSYVKIHAYGETVKFTTSASHKLIFKAADNNYYVESINGTYNTTTGELSFSIVQGADAVLDIPFLNIKKRFTVPAETLYKISDII